MKFDILDPKSAKWGTIYQLVRESIGFGQVHQACSIDSSDLFLDPSYVLAYTRKKTQYKTRREKRTSVIWVIVANVSRKIGHIDSGHNLEDTAGKWICYHTVTDKLTSHMYLMPSLHSQTWKTQNFEATFHSNYLKCYLSLCVSVSTYAYNIWTLLLVFECKYCNGLSWLGFL